MGPQEIREFIQNELPALIEQDEEIRRVILRLARDKFTDRVETEGRFDLLLEELRADREEQTKKWDEQNRKWDEQNRRWDENQKIISEILDAIKKLNKKLFFLFICNLLF